MSPLSTPKSDWRDQLTLYDSLEDQRHEVYLRVELSDRRYENVLDGNQLITHVMVSQSDARRVVDNRGGFGGILEDHHQLTVVGCEKDEIVIERGRYDDLDLMMDIEREFQFVPEFIWLYGTMDDSKQEAAINGYTERFEWLYNQKEDHGLNHVTLTPLAKGLNREHFKQYRDLYNRLGINRYAIYGVQTPSTKELAERIDISTSVLDPDGVLVIGRGSPNDIRKLPSRVDGVAGLRYWKKECNLTADGYSSERLAMWFDKVKRALRKENEQSRLDDYPEVGVMING